MRKIIYFIKIVVCEKWAALLQGESESCREWVIFFENFPEINGKHKRVEVEFSEKERRFYWFLRTINGKIFREIKLKSAAEARDAKSWNGKRMSFH